VEVQGIRCPVMGRVTMDQMMIDVSHLPSPPAPGDTAVLLGGTITAGEIASLAGTIPWHIFTSITDRTVRIASTGSQP
jgi:alanine racemase